MFNFINLLLIQGFRMIRFYLLDEVAAILEKSIDTVRYHIKKGNLISTYFQGRVVVTEEALLEFQNKKQKNKKETN